MSHCNAFWSTFLQYSIAILFVDRHSMFLLRLTRLSAEYFKMTVCLRLASGDMNFDVLHEL